jgi:ribosome-associated toxin RatA of RatAB toxin-antitoxin module
MGNPEHSDSIVIACSPEVVYDMVADITRMGEWSPVCTAGRWEDDAGPQVGAWFVGTNVTPEKTWKTRSEVVVADRGREFTFIVGGTFARWSYTFEPVDGATKLTESWEFLPDAAILFEERFGAEAQNEVQARHESARTGITATLAAIKRAAENA